MPACRSPHAFAVLLAALLVAAQWIAKAGADEESAAALKQLNATIRRDPSQADAYVLRGILRQEAGDLRLAIDDFNQAIRLKPQAADNYLHRGIVWQELEDFDKAIRDFSSAIKLAPDEAEALVLRGLAWRARGKIDSALADFEAAIELDPRNSAAFTYRGIVRHAQGDLAAAIADWTQAVRLDPQNYEAFTQRALGRGARGEIELALADCRRAVGLNPKAAPAWHLEAWIRSTHPEAKYRDGKRAVTAARKACELTAWRDAMSLETLAAAYAEGGNFEEAAKWQTKAIEYLARESSDRADAQARLKLYKAGQPYREPVRQAAG
jgi:tetratricopeptide (TPR) repeat protein